MGDKFINASGARATKKTKRASKKFWCPGAPNGGACCGRGCMIDKGRSLNKTKQTRDKRSRTICLLYESM